MFAQDQHDVVVIGSGIGGLVTATQLAAKGAKVLVLESYVIPGGSAGYFDRSGYRFDVGASMIFGFGDQGTTNLLTKALADVGMSLETIPDPVQILSPARKFRTKSSSRLRTIHSRIGEQVPPRSYWYSEVL